jgi:peptidyl-prolyl cis-trans isomerase SurA
MRSEKRSSIALLVLTLASALPLGSRTAHAELVDRIVAIIDRDVVTLSEAEQARAIAASRNGGKADLVDAVERLIEARLVEREVERFTSEPVPRELVDQAVEEVRSGFQTEEDFRAMLDGNGLSQEELRSELQRQLEVTRYLERRFRALVFVSDEEVEAYYRDELPKETAERPLPDLGHVSDSIRRILEERSFNARVDHWIEELKSRAVIRRYVW